MKEILPIRYLIDLYDYSIKSMGGKYNVGDVSEKKHHTLKLIGNGLILHDGTITEEGFKQAEMTERKLARFLHGVSWNTVPKKKLEFPSAVFNDDWIMKKVGVKNIYCNGECLIVGSIHPSMKSIANLSRCKKLKETLAALRRTQRIGLWKEININTYHVDFRTSFELLYLKSADNTIQIPVNFKYLMMFIVSYPRLMLFARDANSPIIVRDGDHRGFKTFGYIMPLNINTLCSFPKPKN